MITFKQFITEFSWTPQGIRDHLEKRGYKFLASGVDQSAYLEPKTGQVLKIFGTNRGIKGSKFSKDHMMFKTWAEYCEQHKSNQFLPKFSGWESFEYGDAMFLQIRMEKLQALPPELSRTLEKLSERVDSSARQRARFMEALERKLFGEASTDPEVQEDDEDWLREFSFRGDEDFDEISKLVILLGKDGFDKLWRSMISIYELGQAEGYYWDLHGGNFMHRNDGVPVIVDPWVI